jgi:hypothetical protein
MGSAMSCPLSVVSDASIRAISRPVPSASPSSPEESDSPSFFLAASLDWRFLFAFFFSAHAGDRAARAL